MSNVSPLVSPGNARAMIAAAVRAHLAVARMSDSALGRKIGMSQSKVSRRTNEEVPFDTDDLGRIANALGITIVELIQMPASPGAGGGPGVRPIDEPKVPHSDYKPARSGELIHADFGTRTRGISA